MRWGYAAATLAVFLVEVLIALFVDDDFVRPYVGDMLAVVLVYLGLRAVTPLRIGTALAAALAVAFVIEAAQWLHVLDALGLARNKVARIVLGGVFDLRDLVCYGLGAAGALAVEAVRGRRGRD